jgi:hypothetical protein
VLPRRQSSPSHRGKIAAAFVLLLAIALGTVAAQVADADAGPARATLRHGAVSPLAAATNSVNFTDPAGDGPLDVTKVSVSNDDQPNIHFDVNLGTPIQTSSDELVVFIDTDANPSTGGASGGADYAIDLYFPDNTVGLTKWNGSAFVYVSPPAPTLSATYGPTHAGIDIKQSDLGGSAAFNFWVGAFRGDTEDRAPDSSVWRYDVVIGPPPVQNPPPPPPERLRIKSFGKSPSQPRAGETFIVELDVVDADTGKAVYGGVACSGRLGGRSFPGTDYTRRGHAFCAWDLPESSVGKVLAGTIQVSGNGGSTVQRSFRLTVVRPPRTLHFIQLAPSPAQPKVGATFYVAAGIEILEQGQRSRPFDPSGKGTCQATIDGQKQQVLASRWYGKGWLCEWQRIPGGTQGRAFVGSIKVAWHGLTATKTFRFAIG